MNGQDLAVRNLASGDVNENILSAMYKRVEPTTDCLPLSDADIIPFQIFEILVPNDVKLIARARTILWNYCTDF